MFRRRGLTTEREILTALQTSGSDLDHWPDFGKFYSATDTELLQDGFFKTAIRMVVPPSRYTRISGLHELPASNEYHVRGYLVGEERFYEWGRWSEDQLTLDEDPSFSRRTKPRSRPESRGGCVVTIREATFHSQPIGGEMSDVPCDLDIYAFLMFSHRKHVIVGRNHVSTLRKTKSTLERSLALWDWENKHPYALARIEKRDTKATQVARQKRDHGKVLRENWERYATVALRRIGLHWPYRKSDRRKYWPAILRDFGIDVTQIECHRPIAKPRRGSCWSALAKAEVVLSILAHDTTPERVAAKHGLNPRQVQEWVTDFVEAGRDRLASSVDTWR